MTTVTARPGLARDGVLDKMHYITLSSRTDGIADLVVGVESLPVVLGRSQTANVQVPDAMVSRRHCYIDMRDAKLFVRDLESTNGTIVNGEPVTGECHLVDGDVLLLGNTEFVVNVEAAADVSQAYARLTDA